MFLHTLKDMNFKKFIYISLALLVGAILSVSCDKNIIKNGEYRRVVLLYMAANNNLSSFAEHNISALKEGFIPDKDSKDILLVYIHLPGKDPKVIRVFKEGDGAVKEDVVATYQNQNSANSDVLKSVLNKINAIFPAREYGLILWSHATGWLPQGYYNSTLNATYFADPYFHLVKSFGEDRGEEMEIKELKSALQFKLSFLIFDCCLMGGIETIYELKDKADYIIASPTEILAYGFPYREIMLPLFLPKPDLEETCRLFYNYYNAQSGVHQSATISLIKTDQLKQLANVSRDIFNSHRDKIQSLDMDRIQPYFRMNKRWFWDIEDLIREISTPTELTLFKQAMDKVVIGKWYTPKFIDLDIERYSGISTYIQNPENTFLDTFYKGFDWNVDSEMIK